MMKLLRLQNQYLRLWRGLTLYEHQCLITLSEIADILCCTPRHARSLLLAMQKQNWLKWEAVAGRSKKSTLHLFLSGTEIKEQQAQKLLDENKLEHAINLLGDKAHVQQLIFSQLGYRFRKGKAMLNILYYRKFRDLVPKASHRRSEKHILKQIFSGLVQFDELTQQITGDIAHSWQKISDYHWQFYLRSGVFFHHGRLLNAEDIIYSLKRFFVLETYQHIVDINSPAPLVIDILLNEVDTNLLALLSSVPALIIPLDWEMLPDFAHHPIGTGPFKVESHTSNHLKIIAFDQYFGYRSLIDEITIWVLPKLANDSIYAGVYISADMDVLSLNPIATMPIPLRHTAVEELIERRLEDGCYFLLFDNRSSAMQSITFKSWLCQVLSSENILSKCAHYDHYWAIANSLLPQWNHKTYCYGSDIQQPNEIKKLTITYYADQPEYAVIAEAIESILSEFDISVTIKCVDYDIWQSGQDVTDIWLGSLSFNHPLSFSVFATLNELPLFKLATHSRFSCLTDWKAEVFSLEKWCEKLLAECDLHPLFHHWLYLYNQPGLQNTEINTLGWFDFKKAWYR
ncbi:HTH-type transcriptional regulator SgrR [Thorsellia anophelis]|uniref:SgrR family transcriptional regulator n=1 Tax=Thorsellia anophelis DSM 18579 TaxID=1123402 RepID=A0A1H9YE21_9GAMM|nr:HTH-type transcriptional regulator SgrR [Thorsellia anophelis]SES67136.1 SgrR family transcriptional regulator [Thorsellia anophelis DSM 18579]